MASLTRSARLLRMLIVGTCVLPLVEACGRSEPGDYLYNSDGTISVAASSSTGGDSATTGGTRNTTGGANSRSGSGSGGTRVNPSGGASVGTGGSTTPGGGQATGGIGVAGVGGSGKAGAGQGGSGVAGSSSAGTSGVGGQTGNPITCGKAVCDSSTQSCCVGLAGANCIQKNQACGGAVLGCTLNSDCPGNDVCCIAITGDISAASSCKARCDNMGTGRDRQLCQTDNECRPPFRFCTATIFGVSVCTRRP